MNDSPPLEKTWLNGLLFVLTILSTCFVGLGWSASYLFFESGANPITEAGRALSDPRVFPLSALYAAVLMTILVGHELGHYLTCRRYGIRATLPFFIPAPTLIGTLGAFIRIKSPINFKRHLFDIGANGPLVGFLLALPALVVGLAYSRVTTYIPAGDIISFGEPLLFKLLSALFFGQSPEGSVLVLHPVGFAGWLGILVTSSSRSANSTAGTSPTPSSDGRRGSFRRASSRSSSSWVFFSGSAGSSGPPSCFFSSSSPNTA